MKRPTYEQMQVAALWLENNEGDEAADCNAVAEWIKAVAEDVYVRKLARENGVPVARLRRKLAEQKQSLKSE